MRTSARPRPSARAAYRCRMARPRATSTASTALVQATRAQGLVFLGDLFHAREAHARETIAAMTAWREAHARLDVVLVEGNHDRSAGAVPAALEIRVVQEPWPLGAAFCAITRSNTTAASSSPATCIPPCACPAAATTACGCRASGCGSGWRSCRRSASSPAAQRSRARPATASSRSPNGASTKFQRWGQLSPFALRGQKARPDPPFHCGRNR